MEKKAILLIGNGSSASDLRYASGFSAPVRNLHGKQYRERPLEEVAEKAENTGFFADTAGDIGGAGVA